MKYLCISVSPRVSSTKVNITITIITINRSTTSWEKNRGASNFNGRLQEKNKPDIAIGTSNDPSTYEYQTSSAQLEITFNLYLGICNCSQNHVFFCLFYNPYFYKSLTLAKKLTGSLPLLANYPKQTKRVSNGSKMGNRKQGVLCSGKVGEGAVIPRAALMTSCSLSDALIALTAPGKLQRSFERALINTAHQIEKYNWYAWFSASNVGNSFCFLFFFLFSFFNAGLA